MVFRAARRLLLYYARQKDISLSQVANSDFQGEGIWTKLQSATVGSTLASAGNVQILKEPYIGEEGSGSHKVHWLSNIDK